MPLESAALAAGLLLWTLPNTSLRSVGSKNAGPGESYGAGCCQPHTTSGSVGHKKQWASEGAN